MSVGLEDALATGALPIVVLPREDAPATREPQDGEPSEEVHRPAPADHADAEPVAADDVELVSPEQENLERAPIPEEEEAEQPAGDEDVAESEPPASEQEQEVDSTPFQEAFGIQDVEPGPHADGESHWEPEAAGPEEPADETLLPQAEPEESQTVAGPPPSEDEPPLKEGEQGESAEPEEEHDAPDLGAEVIGEGPALEPEDLVPVPEPEPEPERDAEPETAPEPRPALDAEPAEPQPGSEEEAAEPEADVRSLEPTETPAEADWDEPPDPEAEPSRAVETLVEDRAAVAVEVVGDVPPLEQDPMATEQGSSGNEPVPGGVASEDGEGVAPAEAAKPHMNRAARRRAARAERAARVQGGGPPEPAAPDIEQTDPQIEQGEGPGQKDEPADVDAAVEAGGQPAVGESPAAVDVADVEPDAEQTPGPQVVEAFERDAQANLDAVESEEPDWAGPADEGEAEIGEQPEERPDSAGSAAADEGAAGAGNPEPTEAAEPGADETVKPEAEEVSDQDAQGRLDAVESKEPDWTESDEEGEVATGPRKAEQPEDHPGAGESDPADEGAGEPVDDSDPAAEPVSITETAVDELPHPERAGAEVLETGGGTDSYLRPVQAWFEDAEGAAPLAIIGIDPDARPGEERAEAPDETVEVEPGVPEDEPTVPEDDPSRDDEHECHSDERAALPGGEADNDQNPTDEPEQVATASGEEEAERPLPAEAEQLDGPGNDGDTAGHGSSTGVLAAGIATAAGAAAIGLATAVAHRAEVEHPDAGPARAVPSQTLLIVCHANVCRSPLAQRILQRSLARGPFAGAVVTSAGTEAPVGAPMCEVSAGRLEEGDQDFVAAHHAQQLEPGQIRAVDLVLAADRELRSAVVRMAPGTQAKVFTWREAVALAGVAEQRIQEETAQPAPDLADVARLLHSMRGQVVFDVPEERRAGLFGRRPRLREPEDPLSVPDGHGADPRAHQRVTARAAEVAAQVAERLAALAVVPAAS